MLSMQETGEGLMTLPMANIAAGDKYGLEFERKLVVRIQGGEREAFTELVRLYQKKIFAVAYGFFRDRDDALEIVQETFMRIYGKIGSYRPDHSLQSWIYRLTHNLCIDYYRKYSKKKRRECSLDEMPDRRLVVVENGQNAWESRRMLDVIEQALHKLSLRQRSVFILKYRQGLKLQQVAETMGVSLGTVKSLHHRALNRMRMEVAPGAGGEHESMS